MNCVRLLAIPGIAAFLCLTASTHAHAQSADSRRSLVARAQIWTPTDVAAMDPKRGPVRPGAFAPGETVYCEYLEKKLDGHSAKFACRIGPDDEVKVKFGGANGEVYGEVAATRLLWALGFGADAMYPVRVICRGCPISFGARAENNGERIIDPAVIERKMPGRQLGGDATAAWAWPELDRIDERAGGATRAQRDALKLLAVLIQHTDTKPEQQRLVCLDEQPDNSTAPCARPFMLINDLGLTFGRANLVNANAIASVNLREWEKTPVWKGAVGCVGNLPKSLSGTLKDPAIGEEGRRFLADLLLRLSDAQLHDLFDAAQVERRSDARSIDEWVHAFKKKREAILERRCLDSWSVTAPPTFGTGLILRLQSLSTPALTRAMNIVSLLGYTGVYMALAAALAFGYRLRAGVALLILLALHAVVTDATKAVVSFPRPDVVDSRIQDWSEMQPTSADDAYGFPSGHVAAATVFFLGLVFLFGWRWAWIAMAIWLPILAVSRMYLGRDFPGDVLGGFGVGVIVTAIGLQALNLARLENPVRASRVARRTVVVASALTASALILGVPDAHLAGGLLGIAVVGMLLVCGTTPRHVLQ